MLKKALTRSGQRILKAIKKLSTRTKRSGKKSSQPGSVSKVSLGTNSTWRSVAPPDHEAVSLSWSLASLDTKSVDTYLTFMSENLLDSPSDCPTNNGRKCCCCCAEYEENQRNENRENEMFV